MKGWFPHHGNADADRVTLDDALSARTWALTLADRSCCCAAPPVITVIMPPAPGRPHQVDLLLCGHHYRASHAALVAARAAVYDKTGSLIMSGPGEQPARSGPIPAATGTRGPSLRNETSPGHARSGN